MNQKFAPVAWHGRWGRCTDWQYCHSLYCVVVVQQLISPLVHSIQHCSVHKIMSHALIHLWLLIMFLFWYYDYCICHLVQYFCTMCTLSFTKPLDMLKRRDLKLLNRLSPPNCSFSWVERVLKPCKAIVTNPSGWELLWMKVQWRIFFIHQKVKCHVVLDC